MTGPTIGSGNGPTGGAADATPAAAGRVRAALRQCPRWVIGALLASVALNLLVLGLAAGAAWHLRFGQIASGGNLLGNLVAFSQTLPPQRRAQLGSPSRETGVAELRTLRRELRQARREVMRQFTADPFDVAAFRAAEAKAVQAETRMRENADGLAATLTQQLTAAERTAFLKWRDRSRGRFRPDPAAATDDNRPAKLAN
jgi:uncharacterized membrane protein